MEEIIKSASGPEHRDDTKLEDNLLKLISSINTSKEAIDITVSDQVYAGCTEELSQRNLKAGFNSNFNKQETNSKTGWKSKQDIYQP